MAQEKAKIRFRDLSGWLKTAIVFIWILFIVEFAKSNPDFFYNLDTGEWIIIGIIIVIYPLIKLIRWISEKFSKSKSK